MIRDDVLFLQTIDRLTESLHSFGMRLPRRPQTLEHILPRISTETKLGATQGLNKYMDILNSPVPGGSVRELSLGHFEIFRRVAGIKLADPDFMNDFQDGDICEAYTTNHQQIFRNLEFFKTCSYDLFTLTMVPWSQLYSRPEVVKSILLTWAEKIVEKRFTKVEGLVPDHVIQECYADHQKSFIYAIKQAGCILDSVTNEPKGYVTIIRVQELDEPAAPGIVN